MADPHAATGELGRRLRDQRADRDRPGPKAHWRDQGRCDRQREPHDIHRCPSCETAVWSHYGGRQALSFVRVGTLDEPSEFPPDVHIYTRTKLPLVALPANVPAYEVYYES